MASTALLLGATAVYYLLVLGVGQRWRGHFEVVDGQLVEGDGVDLLSLWRTAAFWMAVSTVLGPLVGIVSWRMRVGDYRESAALVGLVFALCSAQGLHMLLFETNWLWLDGFGAHRLLFAALTIAVAALAAGYLTLSRRLAASWALTSAVLSSVLGLCLWRVVELMLELASR